MNKQQKILLILVSVIMMIMMGSVYTWSVFRVEVESVFDVNTTLSGLPYMVSLFFYAFGMLVTGKFLTVKRIKAVALTGSLFIGIGWILASISVNIVMLTIFYGGFIGIGVGMVYGIPIYIVQRAFKERSGFYTGIILLGFGVSPLITSPLSNYLITNHGLSKTFLIFGISFLILLVILSNFLNIKDKATEEVKIVFEEEESSKDFRYKI